MAVSFVKRVRRFVSLYAAFARISIRTNMAYRGAFWAGVVGQWLSYGSTFATLFIVALAFDSLAGWDPYQILFLYAMNILSYAIGASFCFDMAHGVVERIRTGDFDDALTKPVHPFEHEFLQGFNPGYFSHATISLVLMVYSLIHVGFTVTFGSILLLIGAVIGASLIQGALLIISSAASFVMLNDNPVLDLVWDLKGFTNYPINIYPAFIQIVLTLAFPVAFISFYPSSALLNVSLNALLPSALGYITPLVGGGLFLLSMHVWNMGAARYQSTGS